MARFAGWWAARFLNLRGCHAWRRMPPANGLCWHRGSRRRPLGRAGAACSGPVGAPPSRKQSLLAARRTCENGTPQHCNMFVL